MVMVLRRNTLKWPEGVYYLVTAQDRTDGQDGFIATWVFS